MVRSGLGATGTVLGEMLTGLCAPSAYPFPVEQVYVRQTHISVVCLAGEFAYKVKKPVSLGFLDFSTLAKRRHFCEEEVRLNLRLAPGTYLGVVPITRNGHKWAVEGTGEAVEWAVKMRRLPDNATLLHSLRRETLDVSAVEALARRIVAFHAGAAGGQRIGAFGRFKVVAGNARENLTQSVPLVGITVSRTVHDRLGRLTEEMLTRLHGLIDDRAKRCMPRDTHGDLHLDHVYFFPDRLPPDDFVVIDCIEFNERFRFADPVADMAFLVMDLRYCGRPDLATAFADAYFRAANDDEGRALLPFYVAYRSAVRAKVEGIESAEAEVPEMERAAVLAKAKAHWLLALGKLETPGRKPCIVLVAGLPGTGKSTLARTLADRAGFTHIRSDVVRKELAACLAESSGRPPIGGGIYSPDWNDRTYAECLHRAENLLFEGQRVIVDANFGAEIRRRAFLEAAARWALPIVIFVCEADPTTAKHRLETRTGDVSDADWAVYLDATEHWEPLRVPSTQFAVTVSTSESSEEPLTAALTTLRSRGLVG